MVKVEEFPGHCTLLYEYSGLTVTEPEIAVEYGLAVLKLMLPLPDAFKPISVLLLVQL